MKSAAVIFVALACELVQAHTATVDTKGAAKDSNTISASVPMNSMTITIGIIFLLQLLFCFGICCYTNK